MKKFRLPPGLGDELDEQLSIENKVSFLDDQKIA